MNAVFTAPELHIVYLIAINLTDLLSEYNFDVERFLEEMKKNRKVEGSYIPAEVTKKLQRDPRFFEQISDDNKLFYASDVEYFEEDYLRLRRFGRIDLMDHQAVITTKSNSIKCKIKPFLTAFNVGVGIYKLWILGPDGREGIKNAFKKDIIDLCFIDEVQITINGQTMKMTDFILHEITSLFNGKVPLKREELHESMLTMIFIKDFPFKSGKVPEDFISQYKGDIFDILTLPDRYYQHGIYDYHKTRTEDYINEVLHNISVRSDFPVFVSNNRFLGIKIMTDKPDYGFHKRIVFNIVLYSNALLQLKLLKNINAQLSDIIKSPEELSLGRLVSMRESVFKDLEEYINTRIQRYEIWRKAMMDAAKELGIPELYQATKERMDMLNMYIQTAYQRSSNILFIILNSLVIIGAVLNILNYFFMGLNPIVAIFLVIIALIIWLLISYKYFAKYIK